MLDRFIAGAKKGYGTSGSMLTTFGKKTDSDISQYELKAYLNRANVEFSDEDCKSLFDSIAPNSQGKIPVSNFLKYVQETEFKGTKSNDNIRMHDMLRLKVATERDEIAESMLLTDAEKIKNIDLALI